MASGDTLLFLGVHNHEPAVSAFPTLDIRGAAEHSVLDFDPGSTRQVYFHAIMPQNYDGGGIDVYIHYAMSSAIAGNVVLAAAFERLGDEFQGLDNNGFAANNTTTDAVPTVNPNVGHVGVAKISFTDGADMDSVLIGELFRLRLSRLGTDGSDTASGDLEFLMSELREA